MKINAPSIPPAFNTTDVYGQPFSLSSLKGSKVLLSFMRFAGCPVCNFRVHELLKEKHVFAEQNIKVVLIYESSKVNMLEYLQGENYPFTFITDPENKFYKSYGLEKSWSKLLSSFFRGTLGKVMKGQQLFTKKINNDGSMNRLEADFLIDETGRVVKAHYARFMGDNLPIPEILTM